MKVCVLLLVYYRCQCEKKEYFIHLGFSPRLTVAFPVQLGYETKYAGLRALTLCLRSVVHFHTDTLSQSPCITDM